MFRKLAAECFGTFWLVFGGCGSAVLAAAFPELGIGFAGVALAFGLTVLTMAFAVGHISGGHFNPAVTLGLWAGGRFPAKDVIGYIIAQVVGGIIAAAVLYVVASGKAGFDAAASGFASNGFGEHSPGGYSMLSAIVIEIVLTCGFLLVIHGATDKNAPAGFAPIAIGLALTLIHLISIPVTNTSVNPARSTAVAIFQGVGAAAAVVILGDACYRRYPRRRAVSYSAGKTRLIVYLVSRKARQCRAFLFRHSFTRFSDLGSVSGAHLILQGPDRSCFRDY
jgi:aquaporin Z